MQITGIQQIQIKDIPKFKLQKERTIDYRKTEIQNTKIQKKKKKLQKYRINNYISSEIKIIRLQKFIFIFCFIFIFIFIFTFIFILIFILGEYDLFVNSNYGWIWFMSKSELWVRGQRQTDTQTDTSVPWLSLA